ncbi:MAG: Smr/MutS family protein [Prevotellaceae bacterium]|jgi:DNA mismatch repair protein MutS2|nr:Smr/MutS family protein [Prevotellaceae bacterium]
MIYPETYETKIGFDKIRNMAENHCTTRLAKSKLQDVGFSADYDFVCMQLRQTSEMQTIIRLEDSFPECVYVDINDFLKKIAINGTYMLAVELFDLLKALHSAKDIAAWFKKCDENKYPELRKITKQITLFPAVTAKIEDVINKSGQIKDNASPELQNIRRNIVNYQQQISKKIYHILKSAQSSGIVDDDATVSVRDGRMVIPVNVANKKKIKGFVHDESATGKTAYIEPIEIVEFNNEIKTLEHEEQREIIKILIATADFIRPYIDELLIIGNFIGEIDFIRAKAKLGIAIDAVMPIVENQTKLNIRQAKHPLLMQTLKKENKQVVPLNLSIDNEKHILLISGPNAGGKSVCLKTTGLLQYMLQCGFTVSVSENSEFGIFNDIFIDIGDEQSIENDLSTYSSHLLNMKTILRNATEKSLVLIDEFGTGTEPAIGGAIAEAVLTQLAQRHVFGVITTHYTNLKHFAANNKGIINGAMLFDTQKIQPLFKLEIGIPGSSFAFEIARKIGLPEDILQIASEKLGDKQINIEKSLREIARDRRYWEQKRNKIKQTDKYLEEITEKYEKELKKLNAERKAIIAKAKEDAAALLANTNKQIENTIRIIKENQAEKEKTLTARKQLDNFKQDALSENKNTETDNIDKKIDTLKKIQQKRAEKKKQQTQSDNDNTNDNNKNQITTGSKVRIKGQSAIGEIVKISEKNVLISYGNIITTINAESVETVSENEYRQSRRNTRTAQPQMAFDISAMQLNFKPSIDVRGMRAEEAIPVIENFIDEAMMVGCSELKILHGKGNGILRTQIRNLLKNVADIKYIGDEHPDFGGAGITVIKM